MTAPPGFSAPADPGDDDAEPPRRGRHGVHRPRRRMPAPLARSIGAAALAIGLLAVGIVVLLALRGHPGAGTHRQATSALTRGTPTSPVPLASASVSPLPSDASAAPTPAAPPSSTPPEPAPASAGSNGSSGAGAAAPTISRPAPPRAPLTVLNNSRRPGLADRAAGQFAAGGWTIADVGNFTGRIPVTTVYFEPGQEGAARALAAQFPAIARVLPRFAGLPGSGLTVVVTREYPA